MFAYEIEIFRNLSADRLNAIKSCLVEKSFKHGERIFLTGDTSDEIFFIRRGIVRILLAIDEQKSHHLATFGAGDFFGDMSFVDHEKRSADAIAEADVDLFVLSRKRFEELVKKDPGLAAEFYESLVKVLAVRFRGTHLELRSLE